MWWATLHQTGHRFRLLTESTMSYPRKVPVRWVVLNYYLNKLHWQESGWLGGFCFLLCLYLSVCIVHTFILLYNSLIGLERQFKWHCSPDFMALIYHLLIFHKSSTEQGCGISQSYKYLNTQKLRNACKNGYYMKQKINSDSFKSK
jgi:hypothetical protein